MKNQILGLLVTISYIGLFGCAPSDSSSSKVSTASTGPSADLQGTYKISCAVDDDFYKVTTLTVGATDILETATAYSDSDCTAKVYSMVTSSTDVNIGDGILSDNGTPLQQFTFKLSSMTITSFDNTVTSGFNTQGYCGLTWVTNTSNEVTGKTCDTLTFPSQNSTAKNIYQKSGNTLYFGEPSGTTYPTTVNNAAYMKQ